MAMTLIETKTLTSTQSSFEFVSIPQDGTDLYLLMSLRTNTSDVAWNDVFLKPNGSSSNLNCRVLYGIGSGNSQTFGEATMRLFANGGGSTSNTFSNVSVTIPNYAGNTNKSLSADSVTEGNATLHAQAFTAGLWTNTSAITSLLIDTGARSFVAGSMISLYKITKGSGGATVS